jgi:hypothetical protein
VMTAARKKTNLEFCMMFILLPLHKLLLWKPLRGQDVFQSGTWC